jgi:hypothetical protein
VLTPLDISLPDLNAEQRKNVDSIVAAIRESDPRQVVLLSQLGRRNAGPVGSFRTAHVLPAVTGKTLPTARMPLPVHVFHAGRGGRLQCRPAGDSADSMSDGRWVRWQAPVTQEVLCNLTR